ncbi:MAG: SulP family inorganic anion transporter [Catenulispora sp.]|nr:SulP family inorganic anion transporter [Catenulispora sp.]
MQPLTTKDTLLPPMPVLTKDIAASLVVFLVALPLCIGVAVASGVPAELGLVTGIVGGLVTGLLPGSSLQVSGPAAGLTVLVFEAVQTYGLPVLGVIVLASGLLQIIFGALRLGRWFRAISVAVVEGMLAGIGLIIIVGQLYTMAAAQQPGSGLAKLAGLPDLLRNAVATPDRLVPLVLGLGTILIIVAWTRVPARLRVVPGALVAVLVVSIGAKVSSAGVPAVKVEGLLSAIQPPAAGDFARLAQSGFLATVLAFTLIASAESLFSAAAVDRLHDGPQTQLDRELIAQGAGNTACGLLGALPMTAVIVRSATNVHAGAQTKASRVFHGLWLLLFAALLPATLELIPIPALAGVLVHAGLKLIPTRVLVRLWREHRGEAVVLAATAIAIVAVNMFEGVLIGLGLAIVKAAWEASHVQLHVDDDGSGTVKVTATGTATFLRLPKILGVLEALPAHRPIHLDLDKVRHLDHACRISLTSWAGRRNAGSPAPVRITPSL